MTLTDFLLARLAEDEAAAKAATAGPWHWEHCDWDDVNNGKCVEGREWDHHGPDLVSSTLMERDLGEEWHTRVISSVGYDADQVIVKRADGEHIARHDPARVLAEVEAKRRIVGLHFEGHAWERYGTDDPCETLRALAQPYADHPDFRDEWRV